MHRENFTSLYKTPQCFPFVMGHGKFLIYMCLLAGGCRPAACRGGSMPGLREFEGQREREEEEEEKDKEQRKDHRKILKDMKRERERTKR